MGAPSEETIENYGKGCFTDKRPEDCHLLGEFMSMQENDWKKANAIFKVNCEEYGYAKSCLQYGNLVFTGFFGHGQNPDPVGALKYFQKGCEIGSDENCLNSGLLLVSPKLKGSALQRDLPKVFPFHRFHIQTVTYKSLSPPGPRAMQFGEEGRKKIFKIIFHFELNTRSGLKLLHDTLFNQSPIPFKGIEFLNKSCDMNNGNACFYLSGMYMSGADSSYSTDKVQNVKGNLEVAADMEKAFSFTKKACELKNMFACANLSQMYANGSGTQKNQEKAILYKKVAEDLGEEYRRQRIVAHAHFKHP